MGIRLYPKRMVLGGLYDLNINYKGKRFKIPSLRFIKVTSKGYNFLDEEITTDFDTAYRATKGQRSCFEKETTSSKVYLIVVVLLGSLNFLVLLELLISKFNE